MMAADDPRHGSHAGWCAHYATGSLPACEPCRRASNRYTKALRLDHQRGIRRMVPVHGSRRRIQALNRIGWPNTVLSGYLGISQQALSETIHPDRRQCRRARHEQIAAMYEALSGTPGPSSRVRTVAANKGIPAPLDWIDIDDPDERPRVVRLCSVKDCARRHQARGLCSVHYRSSTRQMVKGAA